MNIMTVGTQRANIDELQNKQHAGQDVKAVAENETVATHGETVGISEEGRRKSNALRTAAAGDDSSKGDGKSGSNSADANVAGTVNVIDLKKELQKKKSEVKSKQAKLDEMAQAAANDPSKEAQMKQLKNQVTELEKEASKIQSKVHSS